MSVEQLRICLSSYLREGLACHLSRVVCSEKDSNQLIYRYVSQFVCIDAGMRTRGRHLNRFPHQLFYWWEGCYITPTPQDENTRPVKGRTTCMYRCIDIFRWMSRRAVRPLVLFRTLLEVKNFGFFLRNSSRWGAFVYKSWSTSGLWSSYSLLCYGQ